MQVKLDLIAETTRLESRMERLKKNSVVSLAVSPRGWGHNSTLWGFSTAFPTAAAAIADLTHRLEAAERAGRTMGAEH